MTMNARPVYWRWQGRDRRGRRVSGRLAAGTLVLARAELRRRGIASARIHRERAPRGKRIRAADVAGLSRQLATLMSAGVPLARAFEIIGAGHENRRLRDLAFGIKNRIEAGSALSQALAGYPKYFDRLYLSLVATGEKTGRLDEILSRIAAHKEKTEALRRKIKKALFYPAAVTAVAVLVTGILLVFVIPKFQQFYSGFGASLPPFTRWVIGVSYSLQHHARLYLPFAALAGIGLAQAYKRSPAWRRIVARLLLAAPIIGPILRKAAIARFARTLALTFAAGVPIGEGLATVAQATGSGVYEEAVLRANQRVGSGEPLHRALAETAVFPPMVTQMIRIGEEAGAVDAMAARIAEIYEQEVDTLVDGLSSLLEPVIIVVLGIVVGALVIAMYLPIFNLGNVL